MNAKPRYDDLTRVALQNLARVALHVESRHDFTRLRQALEKTFPQDRKPSPLLEVLASIHPPAKPTSFQLIITTNFDDLLEKALTNQNRDFKVVVQRPEGFNAETQEKWKNELAAYKGVVVYKIHGSFNEEDNQSAHSIIITEEDYIKFLTVIDQRVKGIPPLIKSKLVVSTLLFLGYSLEDWDFRTIHKGLIENLDRRAMLKSYAIQRYPSGFWVDFWDKKNIEIRDCDIYDFAADLKLCLGIQPNCIVEALCKEFDMDIYDVVVARRESEQRLKSRKTWMEFARHIINKREAPGENQDHADNNEAFEQFLKTHNIAQDVRPSKSEAGPDEVEEEA
jgi:hypothetical protein